MSYPICAHLSVSHPIDEDIYIRVIDNELQNLNATSSSDEYAQDIKDTFKDIAHNYYRFNGIDDDEAVLHELYQKFTCALTDMASSNALGLKKLQNHFGNLVQLFCHIHPLDTMASKTRSYLKSCQCPTTKEYRCFGLDARVVNLIAAISKLCYKGNGKSILVKPMSYITTMYYFIYLQY